MRAHLSHEEMNQLSRFLRVERFCSERCQWQIHDDLYAAGRKRERVRSEAVLAGGTFGAGLLSRTMPSIPARGQASAPFLRPFLPT